MNEWDFTTYFSILPRFLILLPWAALCCLPMKNQLNGSKKKMIPLFFMAVILCIFIAAWLCMQYALDWDTIALPFLLPLFFLYQHMLNTDPSCSLSVYAGNYVLFSFATRFSYLLDAWLYPKSDSLHFSLEAAVFQLVLSLVFVAILAFPYYRYYTWLIDNLTSRRVWYPVLGLHIILLCLNLLMTPHSYQALYSDNIFTLFVIAECIILLFLILLHMIFYQMAVVITERAKLEENTHLLKIQASQYDTLQSYIERTRRLRHDFRHSVHLMTTLADKGDLDNLKSYLHEYDEQLSTNAPVTFCANAALNALFNYYHEIAITSNIEIDWHLEIPDPLTISELDLASLFGNLMDNAIAACQDVPEEKRFFSLTSELRQGNRFYIVSTNSFNGVTKKSHNGYLSTKRGGNGIGTVSIVAISEKYDGYARFSNNATQFYVDVMLKL